MSDSPKPYNELDATILAITQKKPSHVSSSSPQRAAEYHLRISADFLSRCARLIRTRDALLLYLHMYLRSAPRESKRPKCAHLYGDVVQKGEFFEGKLRVASALDKGHIEDKSKINWFGRTVKQLVDLGLVKQIHKGQRGYNSTYIVYDISDSRWGHD